MSPPEPPPSRWDLRGRLFGADLRIRPLFWPSCLLPGVVFYQHPELNNVALLGLWVAAVLASLLAHETGHVLAARLLGARPRVVLSGLGGHVFGLESLPLGRRVLVLLAGPAVNLLVCGLLWLATGRPELLGGLGAEGLSYVVLGTFMLMWINAFWALLNLLPLWPLDGGRVAVDAGEALAGRRGRTLALLLSLLVVVLLLVVLQLWGRLALIYRYSPQYRVNLEFFVIQAVYCYAFWLSAFRALWGEAEKN